MTIERIAVVSLIVAILVTGLSWYFTGSIWWTIGAGVVSLSIAGGAILYLIIKIGEAFKRFFGPI